MKPEVGAKCIVKGWTDHVAVITWVSDTGKTIIINDSPNGNKERQTRARRQPDGTYKFYGITVIVE